MIPAPGNFTNFGDWLIQRSTGGFSDFKMDVCIALIRTERHTQGWVHALTEDDIKRVLARYKEHVAYWNTSVTTIQYELVQLADALGKDQNTIFFQFNQLPARRFLPAQTVGDLFCRTWNNHVTMKPNQAHQPDLQREGEYVMVLYCLVDGEKLGQSEVLSGDYSIVHSAFSLCISRR